MKLNFGGSIIKYIIIGAVATILPAILSKFIPVSNSLMLGAALGIGGMVLMGKIPYIPQAMMVSAGTILLAPMLGQLVGGFTGSSASSGLLIA